jgi:hypothetical protein
MPAKAGIQAICRLDSCFRRNDMHFSMSFPIGIRNAAFVIPAEAGIKAF